MREEEVGGLVCNGRHTHFWLLQPLTPRTDTSSNFFYLDVQIVQVQQEWKESGVILSAVVDWISIFAGVDRRVSVSNLYVITVNL